MLRDEPAGRSARFSPDRIGEAPSPWSTSQAISRFLR